jgi:peptidoglycan/xylan/chitin deacetylase (PgdA/CDA1 family)
VRPRSSSSRSQFGFGFAIGLSLTLVVAAVLACVGIYQELTGARTVVVATRSSTLVASQIGTNPLDRPTSENLDDAESDPSADPSAVHAGTSPEDEGTPGPRIVVAGALPAQDGAPGAPQVAEPAAGRVRPTPGPRGAPRPTADLPIVMYHHIGPLPPNPDLFRRDLTVSPEIFEKTLDRLAEQGVTSVTMADLFEHFAGGAALPTRSVLLTFDDGYDDSYDHAFRLLKAHGMVGTFFITTDFVERPGYLTWDQIVEMADAGMEIAAHSSNHADLARIGPAELKRQLVEPKAILEEHLGQQVRFVAYPSGKYNAVVMAASRAAGYEAAVTVIHGTRHVPGMAFELRRVRAHGADTVPGIISRLTPPSWRQ